MIQRVGVIN